MAKDVSTQPLATVNGHIIHAGALAREIERLAASLHGVRFQDMAPGLRAELKKSAITKLIREELVLESELARLAEPGEAEIKAAIDAANLAILVQGGEDIVEDEGFQARLAESIRRDLTIDHVIGLFLEEAEARDVDIRRFYEAQTAQPGKGRFVRDGKLELAEIFLEADKTLCPAGRSALILALRSFKARCEAGEVFADLARAHSERPGAGETGGYLGWVRRGVVYDPAFDAACAASVKGMTDAVPLPDGYVLYQVIGRDLSVLPLEEVEDEIRHELKDTQARAAFRAWVSGMMEQADIRVGGTW